MQERNHSFFDSVNQSSDCYLLYSCQFCISFSLFSSVLKGTLAFVSLSLISLQFYTQCSSKLKDSHNTILLYWCYADKIIMTEGSVIYCIYFLYNISTIASFFLERAIQINEWSKFICLKIVQYSYNLTLILSWLYFVV